MKKKSSISRNKKVQIESDAQKKEVANILPSETVEKLTPDENKQKVIFDKISEADDSEFVVEKTKPNKKSGVPCSPKHTHLDNLGLNKIYDDFFIFGIEKSKIKEFSSAIDLEVRNIFSLYLTTNQDTLFDHF